MLSINFLSIFIAAVVAFIIGFLLHGPVLGKMWMRLANIVPTGNEKFSDMIGNMAWNFVSNIISATGLAVAFALSASSGALSGSTVVNGMICGFIVWLGFIVTSTSMEVIWMGRSYKLWIYECFASLVVMLAMGIVIGW